MKKRINKRKKRIQYLRPDGSKIENRLSARIKANNQEDETVEVLINKNGKRYRIKAKATIHRRKANSNKTISNMSGNASMSPIGKPGPGMPEE